MSPPSTTAITLERPFALVSRCQGKEGAGVQIEVVAKGRAATEFVWRSRQRDSGSAVVYAGDPENVTSPASQVPGCGEAVDGNQRQQTKSGEDRQKSSFQDLQKAAAPASATVWSCLPVPPLTPMPP